MADLDNLPNILQSAEAFRAQYAEFLVKARNRNPRLTVARNGADRFLAEVGDFNQGTMLALQGDHMVLRDEVADIEVAVGEIDPSIRVIGDDGGYDDEEISTLNFAQDQFAVEGGEEGESVISLSPGGARSVFGRSAGTDGPRGDILATIDDTFLGRVGGVVGFNTITAARVSNVLADIDLTAESTVAFANGAFAIGGLPFIAAGAAGLGASSGLLAGTGLTLRAPLSAANTWTIAAPNGPHLYLPVTSIPGFVPGLDTLIVDMHLGASTVFEQGNDAIRMGLWGLINSPFTGAAARARLGDRGNHSALQTLRTFDGTSVVTTGVDVSSFNAYSVTIDPDGAMNVGVGTYAAGWPSRFNYYWRYTTVGTQDGSFNGDTLRFLIAFINSSDGTPTTRADVAHLRFRKK